MRRMPGSLTFVLICSLGLLVLGLGAFVVPLWNARTIATPVVEAAPTLQLEKLTWYIRQGFRQNDRGGFESNAPGVLVIRQFPVRLNLLFNIPEDRAVHHFALMTNFWLDAESIQQPLMLSLPEIGENWAVYLNGKEIRREIFMDSAGRIVLQRSIQNAEVLLPSGSLNAGSNRLVFYIAGNAPVNPFLSGWLPGFSMADGYLMGPAVELQRQHILSGALSWLLIGIYLFLGVSQFYQYLRQKEIYLLYFGLFLLTCAGYTFSISQMAFELLPDTAFLTRFMFTTTLAWPALLGLTIQNFLTPARRTPHGLRLIIALLVGGAASVFLAPTPWIEPLMAILLPMLGLSIIYLAWGVIRADRAGLPNARPILIACSGIVILAIWTIIDIEFIRTGVDVIQLFPVFLASAFSAIFIDRLWRLTADLSDTNIQLSLAHSSMEATVAARTAELRSANALLEAQLIEINTLQEILRDKATHDALTGLFNRHFLEETLVRELARAQREKTSLSLVMIDLDFFKALNDRHGHHAGDLVLRDFAKMLAAHFRIGDFSFRYGGEEFLAVLPGMDHRNAWLRTESLRIQLEQKVFLYEGQEIRLTFSAGLVTYPEDGSTQQGLLKLADDGLYLAKSKGRNQVESTSVVRVPGNQEPVMDDGDEPIIENGENQ